MVTEPFFLPPFGRCFPFSGDPYHSSHSVTAALPGSSQPAGPGGHGYGWTAAAGTADSLPLPCQSWRADRVADRSALASPPLASGWGGWRLLQGVQVLLRELTPAEVGARRRLSAGRSRLRLRGRRGGQGRVLGTGRWRAGEAAGCLPPAPEFVLGPGDGVPGAAVLGGVMEGDRGGSGARWMWF